MTYPNQVQSLAKPNRFILVASAVVLLAPVVASADVLDAFSFGTTPPSILTPTTVGAGVSASSITADAGLTLDVSSSQDPKPTTTPWLRVSPVGTTANTTPDAAATANADFKFTLSALPGFTLNLTSLDFLALKGGGGVRGYALRSNLDNFASNLSTAEIPTARPTWTPYSVPLTTGFQGISTVTFKMYSYTAAASQSVEYDDIIVNGSANFSGYAWQGVDGNWDTTSSNWSGPSTQYPDGSNAWFGDAAATTAVSVVPTGLNPSLVTLTNSPAKNYTFGGGALNIATTLHKSGNGTATFNNAVTAGSITAETGVLAVGSGGTLTSGNITVLPTGSLTVNSGGVLGATSGLTVNGPTVFNNTAQTINSLSGASPGVVTLTDTVLTVAGSSTYAGKISGNGSLVKSVDGSLVLSGANDFSGGVTVNGGNVQLSSVTAAGTGSVTVNPNGSLTVSAAVGSPITLAGGTIGATGNAAPTGIITVTAGSIVTTYNPATNNAPSDLIFTGSLEGSGNLTIATINGNNPDGSALRLRGPSSTYSGTVTVPESAKLEIQTSVESGSPMGTGRLSVAGGGTSTGSNGTYSIVNIRNNYTGDTTLGNDVTVTGSGSTYFNMLGSAPAGSVTSFDDLEIGNEQTLAAVATNSATFTLAFNTVHLTGGTARFAPQPVGNTLFNKVENIRLGAITQNVPESGISMDGAATLTLTGTNTYTGPTSINSGTMVLAGSIVGSVTSLNGGTLKGTGTLGELTVFGGTLAPGNSPGILNTGNVAFVGGTLAIEIGGSQAGNTLNSYDQLNVTGTVSLNSPITLTLDFSGYDPADGVDRFVIVNNDGSDAISLNNGGRLFFGTTQLDEGTIFTATSGAFTQDFQVSYTGGTGNDIVVTAVPEPTVSMGALVGLLGLAGLRRRRINR